MSIFRILGGEVQELSFFTSFKKTRIHCETEMRNPLTGRLMQKLCKLRDPRAEWSVLSCYCLRIVLTKCTIALVSEYVEIHCNVDRAQQVLIHCCTRLSVGKMLRLIKTKSQ